MLVTTKTDYIYKDAYSQVSIKIVRARHKHWHIDHLTNTNLQQKLFPLYICST